jgi:hypothetical protein
MTVVDSSVLRFELKKAPKNGMVGAAFSALLDFEGGGLREQLDRSREDEVGMRSDRYPRGETVWRSTWYRMEMICSVEVVRLEMRRRNKQSRDHSGELSPPRPLRHHAGRSEEVV